VIDIWNEVENKGKNKKKLQKHQDFIPLGKLLALRLLYVSTILVKIMFSCH